jgi:hypothetical protein
MPRPDRRRSLFIDPKEQLRLIRGMAVPPLVSLGLAVWGAAWLVAEVRELALAAGIPAPSSARFLLAGMAFVAAAGAFVVYRALVFSHRIAGPCQRMREALRAARAGARDQAIHLRQGDHLADLAEEVRATLAHFDRLVAEPASAQVTTAVETRKMAAVD